MERNIQEDRNRKHGLAARTAEERKWKKTANRAGMDEEETAFHIQYLTAIILRHSVKSYFLAICSTRKPFGVQASSQFSDGERSSRSLAAFSG